jgi:hypothetical protein
LKVPVHARPHDYVYCSDPRKLPTIDAEATLEFTSTCCNAAAPSDQGSQLQVLECLQTFTRDNPGHDEKLPPYHEYFRSQKELDAYVRRALIEQCQVKEPVRHQCVELRNWTICLSSDGPNRVLVAGTIENVEVPAVGVTAADFDSKCPLFYGSDGRKYELLGEGQATPRGDIVNTFSSDNTLSDLLRSATLNLTSNWCSATLHHLLCLQDTRILLNATLSINERNVLVAESDPECLELLPFYTMLGKLGNRKLMRLYTCRGVGTRIIVRDPFPVLTNWSFVPLEEGARKKGLGFRALGGKTADQSDIATTAITGIDCEGVVTTVLGPCRLEGRCNMDIFDSHCQNIPLDHPFRKAMESIPDEGSWLREGSMHRAMQALSAFFHSASSEGKGAAPNDSRTNAKRGARKHAEASESEDESDDGSAKSSERKEKTVADNISKGQKPTAVEGTRVSRKRGEVNQTGQTTEAAGPEKKRKTGMFPPLLRPTKK